MPKVSVIIPCYNQAQYLPHAFGSVLAQHFPDWEIIIVDDGSTDRTAEVSKTLSDSRVRIIRQENMGVAGARNSGILASKGTYLGFLDADDCWQPGFISTCLTALKSNPELAGVYTGYYFIDDTGEHLPQVIHGNKLAQSDLHTKLWEGGFFPPCTTMVRKSVVFEAGLFDANLQGQGYEDWDLWLRIVQRHPLDGIAEPLAEYRVYPHSMSTNIEEMHENRLAILHKHFGPNKGETTVWPKEKRRAYAFTYRSRAFGHLLQKEPDKAWYWLHEAALVWPPILERLDTFYEFVLGDQQLGYRGLSENVDIRANGDDVLRRLEIMLSGTTPDVEAIRRKALGNVYLALAVLSDQAEQWTEARYYLRRACWFNPNLLRSRANLWRFLKLRAGKRLVSFANYLRSDFTALQKIGSKTI